MADLRRHARVYPDPTNPVEVQIMGKGFLDIIYARDVSLSGMGIEVPNKFEGCNINLPIELIITLPPENCFKASGIIKHTAVLAKKGIFGVEFTSIQKGHENDISSYVKQRIEAGAEV